MIQKSQKILIVLLIITIVYCDEQPPPEIYGVRWFFGQHFKYQKTNQEKSNQHLVLMFNSDKEIKGQIYVFIEQTKFSCTYHFLTTQNISQVHHAQQSNNPNSTRYDPDDKVDETFLHRCIIGDLRMIVNDSTAKEVIYSIKLGNNYIMQDVSKNYYSYQTLFNATFRLPYYSIKQKVIVIGDWGILTDVGFKKGYTDIMPCLLGKVQEDPSISMTIFTGDMAYDLKGDKYYKMLKYISVITSKMVFMVTPGNHDTLYHNDTFQLFTFTFYTPQWKQYRNYFYTIQNNHLLFLSYNPEHKVYGDKKQDRIKKNSSDILQHELTEEIQKNIRENFFPIVFSHYPIYCSDINDDIQSCDVNAERFKAQRGFFNNISMKIYLSGHVHVYERSKPICYNEKVLESNNSDMQCPIYIVQGVGGNNEYVQTQVQYPQKNYSAAIVLNTGFGILTLQSQMTDSKPSKITYQHYSALNCTVKDSLLLSRSIVPQSSFNRYQNGYLIRTLIKISLVSLGFTMMIMLAIYIRKRDRTNSFQMARALKDKNDQNPHVEMVQQHFEPPNQDKNKQNTE